MFTKCVVTSSLALVLLTSTAAFAKPQHDHRKPPQEAFTICETMQVGDAVQVTSPEGELIAATCQLKQDTLVAVPKRHNSRRDNFARDNRQRTPPMEAFVACEGLNEGDDVTITNRKGESVSATCIREESDLFAKPTQN